MWKYLQGFRLLSGPIRRSRPGFRAAGQICRGSDEKTSDDRIISHWKAECDFFSFVKLKPRFWRNLKNVALRAKEGTYCWSLFEVFQRIQHQLTSVYSKEFGTRTADVSGLFERWKLSSSFKRNPGVGVCFVTSIDTGTKFNRFFWRTLRVPKRTVRQSIRRVATRRFPIISRRKVNSLLSCRCVCVCV